MAEKKTYLYKVYDADGNPKGVWPDVTSEFSITEEINTAATQTTITLGRPADNYGEGETVAHDFRVEVFAIDGDAPNGVRVFQGYIVEIVPDHAADEVTVIVFNDGTRLAGFPLESTYPDDPFYDSFTGTAIHGSLSYIGASSYSAQSFYMSGGSRITKLYAQIEWDELTAPIPPADPGILQAAIFTDSGGKPGSIIGDWVDQGLTGEFDFSVIQPEVTEGIKYWVVFRAPTASGAGWQAQESLGDSDLSNDQFVSADSGATWAKYSAGGVYGFNNDIAIMIWNDALNTIVEYVDVDPGAMFRDILDRAAAQGSLITYDASTVELTGTVVSYPFNTANTWEGLSKCVELAPAGWYMYIDPAENVAHFHQKSLSADHTFIVGRDILDFRPQKRTQDIVNTIYFVGEPGFYKKFENVDSRRRRGRRVKIYIDRRVGVFATARTIAQALLDQLVGGEIRVNPITIVDNNIDSKNGRDIEAIKLGSMIGVRNVKGRGPSLYDVAYYDQDYYDFNMNDLSSPVIQIVRIERYPDQAVIYCSTLPPDVSKRIEDINRNLEASQTYDNPAQPEVVDIEVT